MEFYLTSSDTPSIPIIPVTRTSLAKWLADQRPAVKRWVESYRYTGDIGKFCRIPAEDGSLEAILQGVGERPDIWSFAGLPDVLPNFTYHIDAEIDEQDANQFALGWVLGCYQFSRYKKESKRYPTLKLPASANAEYVQRAAQSIYLCRDMVNLPANDMLPSNLSRYAEEIASEFGAEFSVIVGDELLAQNYPTIHMVGRASDDAPRLIDFRWGKADDPRLTLVGKGVCFDSGGLDIKNAAGMKLMKKDMGGAAAVLALARMIMSANLPVRLRVLIPAVENAVAGNAFRPLDIVRTRSGLTVEIGNTDAEGRLILCDALTEACSESPSLLIDCATLTGAARIALGTDIPAYFSNNDTFSAILDKQSRLQSDPVWRLPLWGGYRDMLNSSFADINNSPDSSYAGAITAALYLKEFVGAKTPWIHVDMMAWNTSSRPGRPTGGEAMAVRALFAMIQEKFI